MEEIYSDFDSDSSETNRIETQVYDRTYEWIQSLPQNSIQNDFQDNEVLDIDFENSSIITGNNSINDNTFYSSEINNNSETNSNNYSTNYENESISDESDYGLNQNEYQIPINEVKNFRKVMNKYKDGITANSFESKYRKVLNRRMPSFSYPSYLEMFCRVKNVFSVENVEKTDPRVEKCGSDYVIHDSRYKSFKFVKKVKVIEVEEPILLPIHEELQINIFNRIRSQNRVFSFEELNKSYEVRKFGDFSHLEFFKRLEKLIPIDIVDENGVICKPSSDVNQFIKSLASNQSFLMIRSIVSLPTNCVIPGIQFTQISHEQVFNLFKNQIKPICITFFSKPKQFSGNICDESFDVFEKLIYEMNDFYEKGLNGKNPKIYGVPEEFLIPEFICAVKSSLNDWIRVKIIDIQDFNKIIVRSVDFGNRMTVKHNDLRLLRHEFIKLATQAIMLSMNGIKSNIENKKEWRKICVNYLKKYDNQKPYYVLCQFIGLINGRIDVIVYDSHNLVDYYSINDKLLDEKIAQKKDSYKEPNWKLLYETVDYLKLQTIQSEELKQIY